MSDNSLMEVASAEDITTRQRLFMRYFTAILIDLVVINLFVQYWDKVSVSSFSVSLAMAILLQLLLALTLKLEHRVADYFNAKPGKLARFLRLFSAWLILFLSKFVILGIIDVVFGDQVHFSGALHGVVAFIAVIVVMLVAEEAIVRFYHWLGDRDSASAEAAAA